MPNYLKELFIDEAKSALESQGGVVLTDDQVDNAVSSYLDKNPIEPATAVIENGTLKVT